MYLMSLCCLESTLWNIIQPSNLTSIYIMENPLDPEREWFLMLTQWIRRVEVRTQNSVNKSVVSVI